MIPEGKYVSGGGIGPMTAQQQCEASAKEYYGGKAASRIDKPARPSIRERVDQALQDAYRATERANVAAEIGFLIEKNPDFGRLLDLLDRF